jgi:hypothetical protein
MAYYLLGVGAMTATALSGAAVRYHAQAMPAPSFHLSIRHQSARTGGVVR